MFGVSGRAILAALIGGQRDPQVLAQMARGQLRAKIPQLREAQVPLLRSQNDRKTPIRA
jgi:transposase